MLLHWLYPLSEHVAVFNVFRYITFRTAGAVVTALVLSLVAGPWFIRMLRRLSVGQSIREVAPETHQAKAGTPTMGGLLILTALIVPTLLWADLTNRYVWLAIGITMAFGLIGFVDDLLKLRRRHNRGLAAHVKLMLQLAVGVAAGWAVVAMPEEHSSQLALPFFKTAVYELGILYIPFAALLLTGASNAVNLTDGLDGLAIGATLIAAATYAIFSYIAGNSIVAAYLQVPYVAGVGELSIFCGALVGASLGFLWFNCHPAEMIMGDVGSAGRSASWRSCRSRRSSWRWSAGCSSSRRCRSSSRWPRSRRPDGACCAWRRFTITSSSAGGASPRSSCGSGSWPSSSLC